MARIIIHQEAITDREAIRTLCPFNALDFVNEYLEINAACKMCKLCVKKGPAGVFEWSEEAVEGLDKSQWQGVAVYVDHLEGQIHPVTLELIAKARELAGKIGHQVHAVFMGSGIHAAAAELLHYGVDQVHVYDDPALKHFRIEPYTAVFEDFINAVKPSIVLVGGTSTGRSLAPRAAARFRTGLTADCTFLDVQENTDLDQIRPAFGGNIMAHIHTPNHRPQFATVRYKIFSAAPRTAQAQGRIIARSLPAGKLQSAIEVLEVRLKEAAKGLEDAEVIIVAGRGVKKAADLALIDRAAELLNAKVAATRPLIEAGWVDARKQIGLSGRTVKPRLILTCGVSGAIQFVAGMKNADCIVAINSDPKATIFNVAHYGIVADLYQVLPALIRRLEAGYAAAPSPEAFAGASA
jgi:electron transfer flavoprotein alpha subunit